MGLASMYIRVGYSIAGRLLITRMLFDSLWSCVCRFPLCTIWWIAIRCTWSSSRIQCTWKLPIHSKCASWIPTTPCSCVYGSSAQCGKSFLSLKPSSTHWRYVVHFPCSRWWYYPYHSTPITQRTPWWWSSNNSSKRHQEGWRSISLLR